jgi:hypothetical protein
MILLGLGGGMALNPVLLAAMSDVELTSGSRVGGRQHVVHDGRCARARDPRQPRGVLTGGYHAAFLVGALFASGAAELSARHRRSSRRFLADRQRRRRLGLGSAAVCDRVDKLLRA